MKMSYLIGQKTCSICVLTCRDNVCIWELWLQSDKNLNRDKYRNNYMSPKMCLYFVYRSMFVSVSDDFVYRPISVKSAVLATVVDMAWLQARFQACVCGDMCVCDNVCVWELWIRTDVKLNPDCYRGDFCRCGVALGCSYGMFSMVIGRACWATADRVSSEPFLYCQFEGAGDGDAY